MKAKTTRKKRLSQPRPEATRVAPLTVPQDRCISCDRHLKENDRALFVEEEVGRVFCSEECIVEHFSPDIEYLEADYERRRSKSDISDQDQERYLEYRAGTLERPDEIWREKTLAGDNRYCLISRHEEGKKSIWSVCICLFLRGEPSFLFLAFVTRNESLIQYYRRGERMEWSRSQGQQSENRREGGRQDGLDIPWTEEDKLRAEVVGRRRDDDIPMEDYEKYQGCLDQTLQSPDEVWILENGGSDTPRMYSFIKYFSDEKNPMWFVLTAKDIDAEEQIEIIDAFPTRDLSLVQNYRRGTLEFSGDETGTNESGRVLH